ncbi:MAG: glycoside hydrolase family 28 protein [Puniceicoccaceae bacterium]
MATYCITDFGAVADGKTNNSSSIQRAIDTCSEKGGGRVSIPSEGIFVSGTIQLKKGVDLHLEDGAVLQASREPCDYASARLAGEYGGNSGGFLIQAEDADHISLTGHGTIDGQADAFMAGWSADAGKHIRQPKEFRPRVIGLFGCHRINIRGITIRDAAQWTCHLTGCEDVVIHGITIRNALDIPNCDGIDPDHCRNVHISDCHIEAGDDGIVIKTTREYTQYGPSENITIKGCTIISTSSAIKIGSESADDIRDIIVSGCIVKRSNRGLAIQLRDAGNVENVIFSNCIVETRAFHKKYWGNGEAIYITAANRHEDKPFGRIRNVVCQNIIFRGENGVFIQSAEPGHIRDIFLFAINGIISKVSAFPVGFHDMRPRFSQEHGGLEEGKLSGITAIFVEGLTIKNSGIQFEGEERHHWNGYLSTEHVEQLVVENFRKEEVEISE